jgi:hypothetical protein
MARYRFRFDAKGMELDDVERSSSIRGSPMPGASAVQDASSPAGGASTTSPPDPAATLGELRAWLEDHPWFGLDMEILEEREVLLAPPHWSYVSTPPAPDAVSVEDHRQAVRKYARMLADREFIIDDALELAAFASVASLSNDPGERLRDALRALPKGDRQRMQGVPRSPRLPLLLKAGKSREWAEAVQKRHMEIVSATPWREWRDVEEASWKTWKERLQQYRSGRPRFDVDANDLLLRTRRTGPPALFRHELGQMTLKEWSEALLAALRRNEERSALEIPDWVRLDVERELITGRTTLLVILAESATSPTAQWLPSKRHGSLWIERTRWFEYYDALRLGESESLWNAVRWYVAVEVSGNPEVLAQAVRQDVLAAAFGSPPVLPRSHVQAAYAYLGREKLPTQVTPVVPYLEGVKGVDETITRLELLNRPPGSAR